MKRTLVLFAILAVSLSMAAQSSQNSQNSQTANTTTAQPQAQTATAPLVTNSNGLSTNTGTAVFVAPPSAPLVVTPEFHLAPAAPAVGATNATAGNTAGAANATTQIPVGMRVINTVPEFSNFGGGYSGNFETGVTGGAVTSGAAGNGVAALGPIQFDRGVGSGSMLAAGSDTSGRSLGELARENRQQAAGANARVYTNKDIDRINAQPTTNIGGFSGAAVGAGAPGTQQPSNMPAVSQPTNPPSNSNPGVSQPVPPSKDRSALSSDTREMAQANVPPNPADADQASTTADKRLPSGGSILPVVAVVGVLAAGAGLMSR